MQVATKLFLLDEAGEKFFGEGPYRLLRKVEEAGSLHAAANNMGMAYSKATRLLKEAEKSLGFSLTVRRIGGKSGGGSVLTTEAKDFLKRYEEYRAACVAHNSKLFKEYFGDKEERPTKIGCVIMASGLGKRFGGDKLMAELNGKPMIQYILDATENLFCDRVVVTRNEKVKSWCEDKQIPVVYHQLPGRNDTVRLGLLALEKTMGEGAMSGCVFSPADMPFVNRESLENMFAAVGDDSDKIVRMAYQGTEGSPVLFGSAYFEELKQLPEGKGGSEIIKNHGGNISFAEAKEECELWDVDTQEDLEIVKQKMQEMNF